jgi:hypothetical protein
LEKTSYPEREHENGDACAKADDAKDQTCKGDVTATESSTAGCHPPAGDETHDRRRRTEQKPGEPDTNDREDERQDSDDEGRVSKAFVFTRIDIYDSSRLVTTGRWRQRATHGCRVRLGLVAQRLRSLPRSSLNKQGSV